MIAIIVDHSSFIVKLFDQFRAIVSFRRGMFRFRVKIYLRLHAISLRYYRPFGVIECMIDDGGAYKLGWETVRFYEVWPKIVNRDHEGSLPARFLLSTVGRLPSFDSLSVFLLLKILPTRIPIRLSYRCHNVVRETPSERSYATIYTSAITRSGVSFSREVCI